MISENVLNTSLLIKLNASMSRSTYQVKHCNLHIMYFLAVHISVFVTILYIASNERID